MPWLRVRSGSLRDRNHHSTRLPIWVFPSNYSKLAPVSSHEWQKASFTVCKKNIGFEFERWYDSWKKKNFLTSASNRQYLGYYIYKYTYSDIGGNLGTPSGFYNALNLFILSLSLSQVQQAASPLYLISYHLFLTVYLGVAITFTVTHKKMDRTAR